MKWTHEEKTLDPIKFSVNKVKKSAETKLSFGKLISYDRALCPSYDRFNFEEISSEALFFDTNKNIYERNYHFKCINQIHSVAGFITN